MAATTTGTDPLGVIPQNEIDKLTTCVHLLRDATDERVKALARQLDQIANLSRDLDNGARELAKLDGPSILAKADPASPLGRMEVEIKSLMKADPKRTRSQALDQARRENPRLARECANAVA
jgi:hypothetical protein